MIFRVFIFSAICSIASACTGRGADTPFTGDPGVAAIKPEGAEKKLCEPNGDGDYAEADAAISEKGKKTVQDDQGKDIEIFYASGGACILRPLAEVVAVAQNAATWEWSPKSKLSSFNPEFDLSAPLEKTLLFSGFYKAGGGMVTWLIDYYMTMQEGANWKEASKVVINYKKVKGTGYIPYWTGTIELESVASNVTSFVLRENLKAHEASNENNLESIRGALNRLRKGTPEWKYIGG